MEFLVIQMILMTTNTKRMIKRKMSLTMKLSNKRNSSHNLSNLSKRKKRMRTMKMMALKIRTQTEQELVRTRNSLNSINRRKNKRMLHQIIATMMRMLSMKRLQRKICKVNSSQTPSNIGRWLLFNKNRNTILRKRKRIKNMKKTSKSFKRPKIVKN